MALNLRSYVASQQLQIEGPPPAAPTTNTSIPGPSNLPYPQRTYFFSTPFVSDPTPSTPSVTSRSIYDTPTTSAAKRNYKLEVEERRLNEEILLARR
jgi:hypothetical protein